jgi:hypothetical protein
MNREEIIRMARVAGFERLGHTNEDWVCYPEDIETFAFLVAFVEREACAKLCDEHSGYMTGMVGLKIRARGQA